MPILSDTGDVPQESGSEYLHVSIEFLDGTFLSELTKDYSIQSPPFSWTRETDGKEAAVPILQAGGSAFGYAVWMPYQPGWSLLKRTAPTLAASILVLAAIIALLSRRLLRASARARHLAFHDPLSNLANRNLFNETLDRALATRAGDRVGVLCIDLDRFKHVNDTLGHPAGDELIRQLAIRLTSFVSDSDHVARLGGDEFAIILVEHEDALVLETCRRIIDAVATPFELSGSKAFVGASIGTAIAPHHGTSRSELMRKADIALYRAKRNGRNQYVAFEPEMDYSVLQRTEIEISVLGSRAA
jgi:diguanylate cyclase (GGDEF)-like protein